MLAGQLRAARALLGWNQSRASLESGVSLRTIRRVEASAGALATNHKNVDDLRRAFERAGVTFVELREGAGAVLPKQRQAEAPPTRRRPSAG